MTAGVIVAHEVLGGPTPGDTVVVEDGRVVAVTWRDQVGAPPTARHDGAVIVPAFIDAHLHPVGYTALVTGTSVSEADGIDSLQDMLAEASARTAAGGAVMAQRLDDTRLGRLPTRHDLDAAVPDRPTLVYRNCGHVAVVNTAALTLAGIDENTADPSGGSFDRDDNGVPTGVLRETAIDGLARVLDPLIPPPSPDQILAAMESLAAKGIRRIGAIVSTERPLWAGVGDEVKGLCEVAHDLQLGVDAIVIVGTFEGLEDAARRLDQAGGNVRFWGWKDFADGSLGGYTAAMQTPYADVGGDGTLRLDPDRARQLARTSLDLGGIVAIHAIGDRAIDHTLDVYDELISQGADPSRLRVEHVSVPSSSAITRIADTGVVASVQPSFLVSESAWVPPRLGPGRTSYPLRSMLAAGVQMIGGSDCPVEPPDPLPAIAAAVERTGWDDDQSLPLADALTLYTAGPAAHLGAPHPLATGSAADFVVVSGGFGSPDARVENVYRNGAVAPFRDISWPA